jgi:hypothetical protein
MTEVHFSTTGRKRPADVPFEQRLTCSVQDAVAASGLSRSHLYKKMLRGELEYRSHGKRRLVVVQSLRKLLGLSDD